MKATVVGRTEPMEGAKSKKSGKPYHFSTFYLSYDKARVDGVAVMEQFISFLDYPAMLDVKVGGAINLDFDGDGHLLDASVIQSAPAAAPAAPPPAAARPQPKPTK